MMREDSKDPNTKTDAADDELPPEPNKLRRTLGVYGQIAGVKNLRLNERGQVVNTLGYDLKDKSNRDFRRKVSPEIKQEYETFKQNNPDIDERLVVDTFVAVKKSSK